MVRALARSILGRKAGASFCSMMVQRTPRRPRSMAKVRPVGPAPTIRTSVFIFLCDPLFRYYGANATARLKLPDAAGFAHCDHAGGRCTSCGGGANGRS